MGYLTEDTDGLSAYLTEDIDGVRPVLHCSELSPD